MVEFWERVGWQWSGQMWVLVKVSIGDFTASCFGNSVGGMMVRVSIDG